MNDNRNPTTIEQLLQKYNFSDISKTKKALELNQEGITKVNNELNSFVSNTTETLTNLQNQVDGNITTWFFSGVPTLENSPANEWTTTEIKDKHIDDLYYDKATGYSYRFDLTDDVYSWKDNDNKDIAEALALANAAKDTADGKRRTFLNTPTTPYDNGDLWINEDEIYICQVSKPSTETYDSNDFINNLKYTDDTKATEVDGKVTVLSGQVSTIEQNVSQISQEVSSTSTLVDEISGDITLINQSVAGITNKADSVEIKVESVNQATSLNENVINELKTVLGKYFDFREDGLTIKTSGSDLTLNLDNDAITFKSGANVKTKITDESMDIGNATITDKMQVGKTTETNFFWQIDDETGNLDLNYGGEY